MTRHAPETVVGVRRDDLFADDVTDGSFTAYEGMSRFHCVCPCGCGSHMNLPVYLSGQEKPAQVAWVWNGNVEKPTLSPSIHDLSGCKFHGFITDGIWTFTGDSGA